ncbi:unnamed protein product [Closterium sp. Yama58-4]|nr:unnamed protein product [Closterium sp. Yama58-4]
MVLAITPSFLARSDVLIAEGLLWRGTILKRVKYDRARRYVSLRGSIMQWWNSWQGIYDWDMVDDNIGFLSYPLPSHQIVRLGLKALAWCPGRKRESGNAESPVHVPRYDDSGEGALLLTNVPLDLLDVWQRENGHKWLDEDRTVVGMFFLPPGAVDASKRVVERVIEAEGKGMQVIGWREVPVNKYALGVYGRATMPSIHQLVLSTPGYPDDDPKHAKTDSFDDIPMGYPDLIRSIHLAANGKADDDDDDKYREAGREVPLEPFSEVHVCSLASKYLVYKAVCRNTDLADFYPDLKSSTLLQRLDHETTVGECVMQAYTLIMGSAYR